MKKMTDQTVNGCAFGVLTLIAAMFFFSLPIAFRIVLAVLSGACFMVAALDPVIQYWKEQTYIARGNR
jgi:hypothetical protein